MNKIQPGQMLGAYQIISQIGRGGMAAVYKAYHASMDRYVATKILPHEFMHDEIFLGRFQQEVRPIAKLEYPRIFRVYDYGESEGTPYLVIRYLDADTLKERMQAGRFSLDEVDPFFTQLADGLAYAHKRGVIHRDIKPSNALVDEHGDIFLTDFGVAKLVEGSKGFTTTGAMTGTPAHMSPEQAQGQKMDQRTDIYSLLIIAAKEGRFSGGNFIGPVSLVPFYDFDSQIPQATKDNCQILQPPWPMAPLTRA